MPILKFRAKDFSQLFKLNTLKNIELINLKEKAKGIRVQSKGIPFQGLVASSIHLQVRRMISV